MRKVLMSLVVVVALLALLAATTAWGKEAGAAAATGSSVVISTKTVPKLGTVLVNSKGITLYVFVPDKQKKVTCVSTCAVVWPPVLLPKGANAVAKGQAQSKLLGSDPDPAGGRVVTYNGWPLIFTSPILRPARRMDRPSTSTAASGTCSPQRGRRSKLSLDCGVRQGNTRSTARVIEAGSSVRAQDILSSS